MILTSLRRCLSHVSHWHIFKKTNTNVAELLTSSSVLARFGLWTLAPRAVWITYMPFVRVLENITFCSLFTNRLRPFRDFIYHTVTSINHPSSCHRRREIQCYSLSLLVFRSCNEFCTVRSHTVLNTWTLQMCFCISARLYLIVSPHCLVQFIRSRLIDRTPKELFLLLFSVGEHSVHH